MTKLSVSLIHKLPMGWAGRFALLRLVSQWRSIATVIVGVLLAAVIGASIILYTNAIAQVGMLHRLAAQPPSDVHFSSWLSFKAWDVENLDAAWVRLDTNVTSATRDTFDAILPGWVNRTVSIAQTDPMQIVKNGTDIGARARVAYYEDWQEVVQLVEGKWPEEPSDPDADLEAAIGLRAAMGLELKVGDEIVLDQRGWMSSVPVRTRITALVREIDETDPYWMAPSPLRLGTSNQGQPEASLLTTRAGFLRVAVEHVPETRSMFGWRIFFDHTRIPFSRVDSVLDVLSTVEADLPVQIGKGSDLTDPRLLYTTRLPQILKAYRTEVTFLNVPFGLVLLQVGGLALFFLTVTAALVRRGERREISMLQSRGAYDQQILLLRGIEALWVCGLATLAAPYVARQILVWLVPLLTGLEQLPLPLSPPVWGYAGVMALMAWTTLIITLRPILQMPLIMAGGSAARSEKRSWLQRSYLDVILLVIGLAALWRMLSTRSALATTQQGRLQIDPLLLLTPTFLLMGLGSLLLRLFPVVMGTAARFFSRRRGLAGTLALWQISREPTHYSRITFLLALAISIGWFATSFQATVTSSHRDQARYFVGADVRLETHDTALGTDRTAPPDLYLAMPEVRAASSARRFFLPNAVRGSRQSKGGEILAVDSMTLGNAMYWRDDLGPIKYPPHPQIPAPGRTLPVVPLQVGLWARLDAFATDPPRLFKPGQFAPWLDLDVRLQDEAGALVNLSLLPTEPRGAHMLTGTEGWVYYEGDLSALEYKPAGTLRLDSVYWSFRVTDWFVDDLSLSLTDLTLMDTAGGSVILNWLTDPANRWELVDDPLVSIEKGATMLAVAPGAPLLASRQVTWNQDKSHASMGLFLDYPEIGPIPAIASETLMVMNSLLPGASFQMGSINGVMPWFQIVDIASYFPTLYEDQRLFLVADQTALLYTLNRRPGAAVHPTETWLKLAPGVDQRAFVARLNLQEGNIIVAEAVTLPGYLDTLQTDTLSVGLMGLLYLAFLIALALSVVSLLTYVSLTTQARRGEFGVLRAFGLSVISLTMSVALEQIVVMVTAGLIGGALGAALTYMILPIFITSASDEVITPPPVVHIEPEALLQYSLILLAVLTVSLIANSLSVWRSSLSQTLRPREE